MRFRTTLIVEGEVTPDGRKVCRGAARLLHRTVPIYLPAEEAWSTTVAVGALWGMRRFGDRIVVHGAIDESRFDRFLPDLWRVAVDGRVQRPREVTPSETSRCFLEFVDYDIAGAALMPRHLGMPGWGVIEPRPLTAE